MPVYGLLSTPPSVTPNAATNRQFLDQYLREYDRLERDWMSRMQPVQYPAGRPYAAGPFSQITPPAPAELAPPPSAFAPQGGGGPGGMPGGPMGSRPGPAFGTGYNMPGTLGSFAGMAAPFGGVVGGLLGGVVGANRANADLTALGIGNVVNPTTAALSSIMPGFLADFFGMPTPQTQFNQAVVSRMSPDDYMSMSASLTGQGQYPGIDQNISLGANTAPGAPGNPIGPGDFDAALGGLAGGADPFGNSDNAPT
jgi:hypothetical protein